jgi:hypothetical protein
MGKILYPILVAGLLAAGPLYAGKYEQFWGQYT